MSDAFTKDSSAGEQVADSRVPDWDVVISNFHPSWSGHAAEGLQRAGFRVLTLGSIRHAQPGDKYQFSKAAWALRHLSRFSPAWKEKLFLSGMRRMEAFAQRECLSGALFWGWLGFSRGALERCRANGIPTVLDVGSTHLDWCLPRTEAEFEREGRGAYSQGRQALQASAREEYGLADRICVPSEFVADTFVECGVSRERVFVNPFGVDMAFWNEATGMRDADAEAGVSRPLVYVFGANVMLRKGVAHLLRAWELFAPENAELWLAGGLEVDCAELVASLPEGVSFLGSQSWEQLREIYARADVYLLPSLEEGMARSVMEAAAAGLPVIVTRETGTAELITEGKGGWVVAAGDAESLAGAMSEAMAERENLREFGQCAQNSVAPYTWEAYGERAAKMVGQLLGAAR